jgi:predicted molibdopterin-dependent oxidoreductase YjgC
MSAKQSERSGILDSLRSLVHARDGKLTQNLLRAPGRFGLGQVPAALRPDQTTTMVCGFCSTGCGLRVHLKDGEAVNLSPETRHPVNLGMACPKGWEALAPLKAPDRARTPLLRNERGTFDEIGTYLRKCLDHGKDQDKVKLLQFDYDMLFKQGD